MIRPARDPYPPPLAVQAVLAATLAKSAACIAELKAAVVEGEDSHE